MKRTYLASSLVIASALFAPDVRAESKPDPYASYRAEFEVAHVAAKARELFKLARAAEKAGRMDDAIEHYQHAYEVHNTADVQVELGLALVRAGRYVEAARNLALVLALGAIELRPADDVRDALKEAKKHIGTLAIYVNERDVVLNVDGDHVAHWPFYKEVYVAPGEHNVKVTKYGFWMSQQNVTVGEGQEKEMLIALQQRVSSRFIGFETPVNVNMNMQPGKAAEHPTWPTKLMIVSGVGVGLGTGALAMGLVLASKAKDDQSATTWTGVAAGGGALLGLSLTGLIIGAAGIASRPDPPPVMITPTVGRENRGVEVTGKW